uniref:DUF148 domain-containing protein n=1 Tax=Parascaris univalens TaxID=6257 RepID=A0A915BEE6_PARUN
MRLGHWINISRHRSTEHTIQLSCVPYIEMKASIIFCAIFVVLCVRAQRPRSFESHKFGLRQRFGGFNHRRNPPFANETSDEAKQQLLEIFKNRSLTKGEIDEKVQEWVNSQNNSVQIAYEQFETGR